MSSLNSPSMTKVETQDVVAIESDSDRGQGEWFHDSAIAAARRFRYVPRYENGVPVSVPKVRNKITYVLGY